MVIPIALFVLPVLAIVVLVPAAVQFAAAPQLEPRPAGGALPSG